LPSCPLALCFIFCLSLEKFDTMKKLTITVSALLLLLSISTGLFAQVPDTTSVIHKVIKQNNVAFVGKILSQDAREILMETQELGLVYIPKHEVKEIVQISLADKMVTGGLFNTRYFLTTNGFAVKKGDNYVQWNLFGPDFQFGVADNFGVGIMTSWLGMPIIGTAKYSLNLGKHLHAGIGFLGGTGSWAFPEFGLALPFGFFTIGNQMYNVNISAGYGALFMERTEYTYTIHNTPSDYHTNSYTQVERTFNDSEGRTLFSLAGMCRINKKFSFVFDSFFMMPGKDRIQQNVLDTYDQITGKSTYFLQSETYENKAVLVIAPGLRFQANENNSFQFGFTGVRFDGEFVPVPIPLVQWFRKI
jgi:hypothetical protein